MMHLLKKAPKTFLFLPVLGYFFAFSIIDKEIKVSSETLNAKHEILGIPYTSSQSVGNNRGTYLLPSDSCYEKRLRTETKTFFRTEREAIDNGFIRKPLILKDLGKYVGFCSGLYGYFLAARCDKSVVDSEDEARLQGFKTIEEFEVLTYKGEVLAFEGSHIYHTPCDAEYHCLAKLEKNWEPLECNDDSPKRLNIIRFKSESEARAKGYIPAYQALWEESQIKF